MARLTIPDRYNTGAGICFANPNDLEGGYNITNLDPHIDAEREVLESIAERLCAYEDAEELGRLIEMPLALCDFAYMVRRAIRKVIITEVRYGYDGDVWIKFCGEDADLFAVEFDIEDIGKSVFLTRAEAEAALAAQGGEVGHG